ncbi:aldo/keto reductase [Chitinasiproducens palmae]|uniref:Aldo/keto reductase n=1 Tax=Chitinasiproducens palmae TaxID=1770053 RepID=A0A1H2PR40_9BURK|nr:aldo/keto reductase [Chitinasiproducens palmae]SDV49319.1 Aldo/keto reductase [Chitinasiproducens palmae]
MIHERPFGATGRRLPVIGQGTWNLERAPRREALASLRRGIELGLNHIDSAEMYGNGAAEALVGEAIAGRRDDVFLVSKVLPSNASAASVVTACERSLRHLGTDHLDCYLLHWRGAVPLADTFEAFERLREAGKILSYGVSNFDMADLEEAFALVGPGRIACNQVLYHLRERAIEHAVLPWCARHDVAVVAYSPFGQDGFPAPHTVQGQALRDVADACRATPRQVALAFLTREPAVFAIPKAGSVAHVEENAVTVDLDAAAVARLEEAFPRGAAPDSLPML